MGEPAAVYDYRRDVRNVVVTPEIRGRFLRMEPGEVGPFHSHDLGHEVFLVLEGRAEFLIDGERLEVGPGQMCVAWAGQLHEVRVLGDEPMTLFLAVTPHLEPTHTLWEDGRRLAPVYGYWAPAGMAEQAVPTAPLGELAERQEAALREVGERVAAQRAVVAEAIGVLEWAEVAGEMGEAKAAVDAVWAEMRPTYEAFGGLMAAWNDLALRMAELESGVAGR